MTENEKMIRSVRNWKGLGEELDRMEPEELSALSREELAVRINDVVLMADECIKIHPPRGRECGLVEQQKVFFQMAHQPDLSNILNNDFTEA